MMLARPTTEAERIESLDVLRGFGVLGILLLNILAFGLVSVSYSNPAFDLAGGSPLDWFVWGTIELTAEGAMRCLFSILFGAGVLLFTTGERGKRGALYYRRTFWLLLFGLIDAYILLWPGDILVCYALAGALLYFARDWQARSLFVATGALLVLISLFYGVINVGLQMSKDAWEEFAAAEDPARVADEVQAVGGDWRAFSEDFQPAPEAVAAEIAARRGSYASAFEWNVGQANEMLFAVLPMFLFWDALVMMLLGMALYKAGILQGDRPNVFYVRLMLGGFAFGLAINGYEVYRAVESRMDLFTIFAQMQPTYQWGRLGMALGYLGLVLLIIRSGVLPALRSRLGSVGRMALTNYLMQSLICLFIFTGAGLGLVAEFGRATLYLFVFGIWAVQIVFSHWWLQRYRFGPMEWLWRGLTYGNWPPIRRAETAPA